MIRITHKTSGNSEEFSTWEQAISFYVKILNKGEKMSHYDTEVHSRGTHPKDPAPPAADSV